MNLQLHNITYKKINSFFNFENVGEVKIQNEFFINVIYSADNKSCVATMSNKTTTSENIDVFGISMEIEGIFLCDGVVTEQDKKDAHKEIYNYLFPYAQALVVELFGKAGLPPLMLQKVELSPDDVRVGNAD